MEKLKVIITGATGMIGEGVLHECLNHPDVEKVLVISRHPVGYSDPKLTEIIHSNFLDISSLTNSLKGYQCLLFLPGSHIARKKRNRIHRDDLYPYSKLCHHPCFAQS